MNVIKILIVDDNEMDRILATHLLSDHYEFVYAGDGQEALHVCEAEQPDVVLTDLVMPKMDGMELLSEMQASNPQIPVIMMTSAGTPTTSAEAMEKGAASYVPKAELHERLRETVDQIVDMMRADRDYARLLRRMRLCHYRYELESDFTLIDPLVEFVQQIAFVQGICSEGNRHRIGVAFEEALFNAMYHGNLELPADEMQEVRSLYRAGDPIPMVLRRLEENEYASRTAIVDVTTTYDEMRLVIKDGGKGFRPDRTAKEADPREPRGMVLIQSIMDEVSFNDEGNEITLVKAREESRVPESAGASV